jgi:hypothetical protein
VLPLYVVLEEGENMKRRREERRTTSGGERGRVPSKI